MEIVVVPDQNKKEAVEFAQNILAWLLGKRIQTTLFCSSGTNFSIKPDIAILLGGDGFIMRKSLELAKLNIPFLAINFGRKGFLAVAEQDNWQEVLEKVIAGKYAVVKRLTLAITHFGERKIKHLEAAGDVYIRHRTNMIVLNVMINGELIYENLFGDGIVVATPTGATGYNLSAGGPLIEEGIAVTPICPHAVNVKPFVLQELRKIEVLYFETKTYQNDEGCLLFIDGIGYPIKPRDRILIRKSAKRASFIIPEGFSFFGALQKKLGLAK